jgi:two-component system nitrogen regulation sensor histidine kinase NtrY
MRRLTDTLLGRGVTLTLVAVALALAIFTFVVLARRLPSPSSARALLFANLFVLLPLSASVAVRLTRMWVERRRGSAGARLHISLVFLFSVVAVTPTIVVSGFSTVFFNYGIEQWFSDPIRTAVEESLQASRDYLDERENTIRVDAQQMATDLTRVGGLLETDRNGFLGIMSAQTTLRGLTDAAIFNPETGDIVAEVQNGAYPFQPPPSWAVSLADSGAIAVIGAEENGRLAALIRLDSTPALMLLIEHPIDARILEHVTIAENAARDYARLDANRSNLQIAFVLIFALVALLVVAAAALTGLMMANQIARPVGALIAAAERVRAGDLTVRVPEETTGDELAGLSRAFNRMTGQLGAQRTELMSAYGQIDARRRFTEAVLSGVSAGVIGLDAEGRIELPNRAAGTLLGIDLLAAVGQKLVAVVPEFGPLLEQALAFPGQAHTGEVHSGPPSARRVLLVRIGADRSAGGEADRSGGGSGFVATFDDITELQSAQRKAAWSDVARRIAHEIKNPLTPIQLAAERLKRRFAREITSDPETFTQCADTIIRHVGDIGRMVDEFSSFARMPVPVMRREDIGRIARESLILQRNARPQIDWVTDIPERGPLAQCDRRLLGQALTNLLQNASDAVMMRTRDDTPAGAPMGRIEVAVAVIDEEIRISVADDGVGLPAADRSRLTEPYVTHKPKGTGLGLAIVKKIMEDHGGRVVLEDRVPNAKWEGTGAVAILCLPLTSPESVSADSASGGLASTGLAPSGPAAAETAALSGAGDRLTGGA